VTRALLVVFLVAACGSDDSGPEPLFPADYRTTYQEVRNCRFSLDHDLMRIRILASPDALAPYNMRTTPFPTGAVVLKEQYDGDDTSCSGPVLRYTVMVKTATGNALDWAWQELDGDRRDTEEPIQRCIQCHAGCGQAPEGYDGTCAVP
jgi:Cytochrome P460